MDPNSNAAQNLDTSMDQVPESVEQKRLENAEGARRKAELLLAQEESERDAARASEVGHEDVNPMDEATDEEIEDALKNLSGLS